MTKKDPKETVHTHTTYRTVLVGAKEYNAIPGKAHRTISAALRKIAEEYEDLEIEHWRVVEIPSGEPWDYDGIVVASVRTGRGIE